ncbi:DUF7544 domain-containing protein [Halobaculum marinum]|uniref:Membrane-anchored glycerophosphoryl diester phosphodiesterase (GDPDase), membrane domain n=1 Tax=Halobaculum marinum TaxID=3031996 RepID=A0ABD5X1B0_9EURY|nr:hypothetical protein [Halobaculum sp. DT55]
MPIHAVEDLDDAYRATKALLWPIDRSLWLKLAIVAFFVGGPGAGTNGTQVSSPVDGGGPGTPGGPGQLPPLPQIGPEVFAVVAAVIAVALLVGLVLLFVGSVMEFVLIESLRAEDARLGEFWGRRWRQGVRLFGFRFVLSVVVFGAFAVVFGLAFAPLLLGGSEPGISVVSILLLVPVLGVLALVTGLVDGFTTVFVVPIMVLEDRTVLGAWGRLWPTITANPWQFLAYVVASVILNVVVGIAVALAIGIAAVLLLIPFGILGGIGVLLLSVLEPLGIGLLVVAGILFGVSLLVAAAFVQVPAVAYLRYYALLVLGDIESSFDLIPERRAAVRADGGESDEVTGPDDEVEGTDDTDDTDNSDDTDDTDDTDEPTT